MQDILSKAAAIKLIIFDVDGVLTDGSLFLGDDGLEYKAFHSRDGHGMKLLKRSGVEIAIITGRSSKVVQLRMDSLGIDHVYQGQEHKLHAYEKLLATLGLQDHQVAYMGDDVVDLPVMVRVGLAMAVADAHPLVTRHAHWQSRHGGGQGAAREACELIMEAQGNLEALMHHYLGG